MITSSLQRLCQEGWFLRTVSSSPALTMETLPAKASKNCQKIISSGHTRAFGPPERAFDWDAFFDKGLQYCRFQRQQKMIRRLLLFKQH